MKHHLIRGLAAAFVAAVALPGNAVAADFTMRLAHQFPPGHHSAKNLEQFAADVLDRFGHADLVINNAGVDLSQTVPDTSYDDFE